MQNEREWAVISPEHRGDRAAIWLATGLGVGFVPVFPGTIGGLWGLPLAALVAQLGEERLQVAACFALVLAGAYICGRAANTFGGSKDPQSIVLDEIAVLPIVFVGQQAATVGAWIAGYLMFRLVDMTKPFPCRRLEMLPRGIGIMADDTMAAVYAWFLLAALLRIDRWTNLHWLTLA